MMTPLDIHKGLTPQQEVLERAFHWRPASRKVVLDPQLVVPDVVLFNGPPECGKDTLCMALGQPSYAYKLALYEATAQFFHIDTVLFTRLASNRDTKDKPSPCCGWNTWTNRYNTPREALQIVSELVVKPNFGDGAFGRSLGAKMYADIMDGNLDMTTPYVTISDAGFAGETLALSKVFDNRQNFLHIKIHVSGTDFTGDTRGYWDADMRNRMVVNYWRTKHTPVEESVEFVKGAIGMWREMIQNHRIGHVIGDI